MSDYPYHFDVKIDGTLVYLPKHIATQLEFGKTKRLRIDGEINGVRMECGLMPSKGKWCFNVSKKLQKACGISPGDMAKFCFDIADSEAVVEPTEYGLQTGITSWQAFENLDLRAGTITAVEDLPKARKAAYKVTVDFGPELGTKRTSTQITVHYTKDELVGRQIIGVVNLPAKQIGSFMSEFLIVGFYRNDGSVILAVPDKSVPDGAKLA